MPRTVTVGLKAQNQQYDESMKASARHTRSVATEAVKARQATQDMGRGMMIAGGLVVGGLALAERATIRFDKELSSMKAATHANAAAMHLLRKAALQTGKDTQFSATEAARAETALAKAGVSVADILGGALKGATDLAAAGQLDVGQAAEIAASAMVQFGLAGKDVPHIADLLAAAAGKAKGEVGDMAQALKYVGPVAAQMGISMEQTVGTIALLASNAIEGDQAGTSLRGMLTALTSPSRLAATTMEELGLNVYDASGRFVGFEGVAGQLSDALGQLSESERDAAFGRIFGNEQITTARVLYQSGAADVRRWTDSVNDQGYAARTAATKMDNLSGDLEKVSGSLETAFISGTTAATGGLRKLTQAVDGALSAYIALPAPVQNTVTAITAAAGAATLASGAFMVGAPMVAAFKASLDDMGPRSQRFGKAILGAGSLLTGPWGLALAGGVVALGLYGKAKADAAAEVEAFTRAIQADSGAIGENTRKTAVAALEKRGLLKDAERLGVALSDVTAAALGDEQAMARVNEQLQVTQDGFAGSAAEINTYGTVVAAQAGALNVFRDRVQDVAKSTEGGVAAARRQAEALKDTGAATNRATGAQGELGGALGATTKKNLEQVKSLSDLIGELQKTTDLVLGLRDANRGYEAAVDDAQKALKENGRTLDEGAEKGRANAAALDDIAKRAADVLKGMADNGAQLPAVTRKFAEQRDTLVAVAQRFGMTKAEADKYVTSVLQIPPTVRTRAVANTDEASRKISGLEAKLARLDGTTITVTAMLRTLAASGSGTSELGAAGKVLAGGKAKGGRIDGPGSKTSDSVLIRASRGEFMQQASAVDYYGLAFMQAVNDRRFPKSLDRYAAGGSIRIPAAPQYQASRGALSVQALAGANRGATPDQLRALIAAYDAYLERLRQAAERERLLGALHEAQSERGRAKASERAAAQQRVNDAVRALRDFDQAAIVDREKAATDRLIGSLERQAQAREEAAQKARDLAAEQNSIADNMYEVGARTAEQQIALLDERMGAEKKFSDAWTALYRQREQVLADVAAAEQKAADDTRRALDAATNAYNSELGSLNRMLDQADSLQRQMVQSRERHAKTVQQLLMRQAAAQKTLQGGMMQEAQTLADAERRLLASRQQSLLGWASISERASVAWGNTLGQLNGNVTDQIGAFSEWLDLLDSARARGVSAGVIAALGLDEGPRALGQLRMFSTASQAEIDRLNALIVQRTALAADAVHREQVAGYGQLGDDLRAASEQYTEAIRGLQERFRADQAQVAADLRQADDDLIAEEVRLAAELASIGSEQGRSWAEALAAAIASGIPGIQAQVEAVRAALNSLTAAQAGVATAAQAAPVTAGPSGSSGSSTALDKATVTGMRESQWTPAQRAQADMFGWSGTSVFDTGGWLQPGFTLAYNGTGQPERVLPAGQQTSPTIVESHTYVVLDGQVIDRRVETKLGRTKTAASIAGAMR